MRELPLASGRFSRGFGISIQFRLNGARSSFHCLSIRATGHRDWNSTFHESSVRKRRHIRRRKAAGRTKPG
uniref:Uncharacterized protein n=1 Tax=Ascaris lumbricoides TaxID=6252 RepID=A0A0M3HFY5_ASCLU